MKAKYLFTALALPALFAACTNDEFEQIQTPEKIDESVFAGRAVGDLTVFTANEDAETRAGGDVDASGKLKWVITGEDDWLGAAVVDYGSNEAIVGPSTGYDKYVITNLPFVPQASTYPTTAADFKPTTAVVDGAYLFYNRYYGQSTDRRDFRHTIDAITYVDPTDTEYTHLGTADNAGDEENKGQNFFLSPIVDMKVGQDMKATPIMLTSAYNIAQFTFKTDLLPEYYEQEDGFRIHKIELRTMNDNTKFHRTLILDPAKIANLQKEYAETNNLFNTEFKSNGAIITANRSDEEIVTTLKKITKEMQDPGEGQEANIGAYDDETSLLTFQVKSNGKDYYSITDKDQEVKLLLILPAGNYSQNETDLPKAIQGKTKGVFKLSVYTSEGVYHSLLVTSQSDYILNRGVKSVFPAQTMIIKHGETNLETEELKTEFTVNTDEDWRYAIRYINEHALEYNEGNKWHTPHIIINAKEVTVDRNNKDSWLPDYPVKYTGNATLNLKNVGTYNFDPTKVILDATARPTIKIEDATAVFNFNMAVKKGIKNHEGVVGVDGESITAALKFDSKATINVAAGIEVNFEMLKSYTALNVADAETADNAAQVNVSGTSDMAGTTTFGTYSKVILNGEASTAGTLVVNNNAVMTANANYTNSALATIKRDAKVVLAKGGTNKGTINVEVNGLLDVSKATFTNASGATLILEAEESGDYDVEDRSKAEIKTLVNSGKIEIMAGGKEKGTWGGLLNVTSNVTNYSTGEILVNGEFLAIGSARGVNEGVIKLQGDNYAVIQLNGANFGSKNNGYIEITAPTVYRTFAGYYSKPNQLKDVKGTIVATMNAETLATVWAHHLEYSAKDQETAWQVINKINVDGALSFSAEQTTAVSTKKDLVLTNGAQVAAAKANTTLKFEKVQVAENAAAAFKSTNAYTLECANVEILKGATLDNGNNVKVYIIPSLTFNEANSATANTKLMINGTLNNYGQLHTTLKEEPTVLKAVVGANGELNNMGTIGSPAKNPVYYAGAELKLINAINNAYYDFVNTWKIKKSSGSWSWPANDVNRNKRTWKLFHDYVSALQNYTSWNTENGHPQVAKIGNDYYYITITGNGSEAAIGSSTNYQSLTTEVQEAVLEIGTRTTDDYIALGTNGEKNYSLIKSTYSTATSADYLANEHIKKYGHLQDFLFVYENNGAVKFNKANAYGLIKTNNGTISGEFTEKYDYLLEE